MVVIVDNYFERVFDQRQTNKDIERLQFDVSVQHQLLLAFIKHYKLQMAKKGDFCFQY